MAIATGTDDAIRKSGGDRHRRYRLLCLQTIDEAVDGRDDCEADGDDQWRMVDSCRARVRRIEKDRREMPLLSPLPVGREKQ